MKALEYRYFKRDNSTIWHTLPNVYKITCDQGEFFVSEYRLNYKETIADLKKAGYTHVYITCLGRNVSM